MKDPWEEVAGGNGQTCQIPMTEIGLLHPMFRLLARFDNWPLQAGKAMLQASASLASAFLFPNNNEI